MTRHRVVQQALRHALAGGISVVIACTGRLADAHGRVTCTDTIFIDGFGGGNQSHAAATHRPALGPTAFSTDGFDLFTFELKDPGSRTIVGSTHNAAFMLAFTDGNFDRIFGLAHSFGTLRQTLASIRISDAAIAPIGTTSPPVGDWTGLKQDPLSGVLYAVATTCGSSSVL